MRSQSARYASTGPTPRGVSSGNGASLPFVMNTNVEVTRREPLIGRRVMIRWPEDNNFYEATITDYNPQKVCLRGKEEFYYLLAFLDATCLDSLLS